MKGVSAQGAPQFPRFRRGRERLPHQPIRKEGHVGTAAAGDIDDTQIRLRDGYFHVGGPNHQVIAEVLDIVKAHRLEEKIRKRKRVQWFNARFLEKMYDAELRYQRKLDGHVAPGPHFRGRAFDLDVKTRRLEKRFRPNHLARVIENENPPGGRISFMDRSCLFRPH